MRGLAGGTPRDDPSLRRELATQRKTIDLLDQRMQRMQKIPEAAAGGGPVGVAEVFSQWGSVTVSTGPGSGLNRESVTYDAPTVPFGFTNAALDVSDWLTLDGSRIRLEPGWYSVICEFSLVWNTAAHAPDYFKPVIYNGAAGHDWDKMWVPATTDDATLRGLHHFLDVGPQYAVDSSFVLQAQCFFNASPGSTSLFDARISWKICKW